MSRNQHSGFKKRALALAIASCMSVLPLSLRAAELGGLTVYSVKGQPLRAEAELRATPEELAGMAARFASRETFAQIGVAYPAVLEAINLQVKKQPDGRTVLALTSSQPINEPFLDFLVELTWPAGQLVREYSFLLDPQSSSPAAASPESAPAALLPETPAAPDVAPLPEATRPAAEPPVSAEAAPTPAQPSPASSGARSEPAKAPAPPAARTPAPSPEGKRTVLRGDTLHKIASENLPAGVSLEQMLVALYKSNRDAFVGNDINRLKAGAVLNLPEPAEVAAVPLREAKHVYVSAGDFEAYRRKLAQAAKAAPAPREPDSPRAEGGRVTPEVTASGAAALRDQLKVARAEQESAEASSADRIAREKALQDAQERVALLERRLGELQQLLEIKNQQLAGMAAGGNAAPAAPAAPAPDTAREATPAATPAQEAAPVAPAVAPAVAPERPAAAPPVPVPVAVPEAAKEPSLMDTLRDNAVPIGGGVVSLALLAGLLVYRRRRQAAELAQAAEDAEYLRDYVTDYSAVAAVQDVPAVEPPVTEAPAPAAEPFAETGETPAEPAMTAPVEMIAPAEAAPVAEDVPPMVDTVDSPFEAAPLAPEPEPVIEERAPVAAFEVPEAPLPEPVVEELPEAFPVEAPETVPELAETALVEADVAWQQEDVLPVLEAVPEPAAEEAVVDVASKLPPSLDLAAEEVEDEVPSAPSFDMTSINLDLAQPAPQEASVEEPAAVEAAPEADFGDIAKALAELAEPSEPMPEEGQEVPQAAEPEPAPAGMELSLVDFELPSATPAASTPSGDDALAEFEVPAMSLPEPEPELELEVAPAEPAPPADPRLDPRWEEINTKLDLAKAYEEMGDLEGAVELLREVLADTAPDLAQQAKTILLRLEG